MKMTDDQDRVAAGASWLLVRSSLSFVASLATFCLYYWATRFELLDGNLNCAKWIICLSLFTGIGI